MSFADTKPRAALLVDFGPASDGILKRFKDGFGGVGGDDPSLALFFGSYGRLNNQDRDLKYCVGAAIAGFQCGIGGFAPSGTSPNDSLTNADNDRCLYIPSQGEAAFDSFDEDSVLVNFSTGSFFPNMPRNGVALFGGGIDFEVSGGLLNAPTQDVAKVVAHGLAGAPTGFIFFGTGRPLADGDDKLSLTMNVGAAAWDGATITQWCHQFFAKNNVSISQSSGALHDNRVGASVNLTTGATNDHTLELTAVDATNFEITPRGGSPGLNGDLFWIAVRGMPCDAAVVNMPTAAFSDWNITSLPSGEPPMFLMLLGTMLTATNTISATGNGSAFGLSFIRESLGVSCGFRQEAGEINLATEPYSKSHFSADSVNFGDHQGTQAFTMDSPGFQFKTTGFSVLGADVTVATTGPRKAGVFTMRAPAIKWLTNPAIDFSQGSALSFTGVVNCDCYVYAQLVADGASAPNAAAIVAAAEADLALAVPLRTTLKKAASAYDIFEGGIIGITEDAAYDLYVTAKDNAGRTIAAVKLDVTQAANPAAIKAFNVTRA